MKIGDTVDTEKGVGTIVSEEFYPDYSERRFGVDLVGINDPLYPEDVLFFFESHLTLLHKSV